MLQLCGGTTIKENIGNQKSRNPQTVFMKKIICSIFSRSKLWIKIQETLLDTYRWRTLQIQSSSLTGVLGFVSVLTSTNYCVLPLVQGGLEIPRRVEIYVSPPSKNKQLIEIYRNYVDLLYDERQISNTTGSFIVREEKTSSGSSKSSKGNAEKNNTKLISHRKDIRSVSLFRQKQQE